MMRRLRSIVTPALALLFAAITLAFSGRYVAYEVTCEGMQMHSFSINERGRCCCGDSPGAAEAASTGTTQLADDGCCSTRSFDVGVDDYSARTLRVEVDAAHQPLLTVFPVGVMMAQPAIAAAEVAPRIESPPENSLKSGTQIIFTVSRQLRI